MGDLPQSQLLLSLAERVSDGSPIDWESLESSPLESEEKSSIARMRIVAELVSAHDSLRETSPQQRDGPSPRGGNDFVAGASFGRYRMLEKLGEGGMAIVWRALDTLLDRPVALKFLRDELQDSEMARRRFLREARSASRLDHPGIGTIYDFGEHDGIPFIAMQLIAGGTVSAKVAQQGALGLREAVTLIRDAAMALDHAHRRGVTHRDISARNLMLTPENRVVVVDFGLAVFEDSSSLTRTNATMGTAAYMPPEIVQGSEADAQSDLYSLGVVFYQMLTGSVPFDGDRIGTVLWRVVNESPVPPSARRSFLPDGVDAIVLRALAKSPADRQSGMAAFADELDRLLREGSLPAPDDETVTIVPGVIPATCPTSVSRSVSHASIEKSSTFPKWSRRRIAWTAATSVVILAAVAAGVWTWFPGTKNVGAGAPSPRLRSVAVLPWQNASLNKADSDYLGAGLAESLITKLGQVGDLEVTPWMTSRRFQDPNEDPVKLATKLGVEALLVGQYRAAEGRLSGSIALIDGKNGRQVWADEFNEASVDIFRVQSKIALATATRIAGALSGEQIERLTVAPSKSAEAYDLYLRGVNATQSPGLDSSDRAIAAFRKATKVDPNLADAWAGLGTVLHDRYFLGMSGGVRELMEAQEVLQRAIGLDPGNVRARRGLIRVLWDLGRTEDCLKQGKQISEAGAETIESMLGRAEAYIFGGLPHKAIPLLREIEHRDPANPAAPWETTLAAAWADDAKTSLDAADRYATRFGDEAEVHFWAGLAAARLGYTERAIKHLSQTFDHPIPDSSRMLECGAALFLNNHGQRDFAERVVLDRLDALEAMVEKYPDNVRTRLSLANCRTTVGDEAAAGEQLEWMRKHRLDLPSLVAEFSVPFAAAGDTARALELMNEALQRGFLYPLRPFTVLWPNPRIESWPGGLDYLARYALEQKRLETLY